MGMTGLGGIDCLGSLIRALLLPKLISGTVPI